MATPKARRAPFQGRKTNAKRDSRHPDLKIKVQKALDEGDTEGLFLHLRPRQAAFANEYIIDFNGVEAAKRAGYNGKYVNRQAHQMLTHPGIRAAIDTLLAERSKALNVDVGWVVQKLTKTLERCEDDENFNPNAVLRAAELLGKYLGMFIERTEISGKDGGAIQYEKVQEDADAFISAIRGLAERERTEGVVGTTQH